METNSTRCTFCPVKRYGLCAFLSQMPLEQFEAISRFILTFSANDTLYSQGSRNKKTFILKEGWVLLTRISKGGKRQVLRSVLPGELFGFHPDLNGPRPDSAAALLNCTVCVIPDIEEVLRLSPDLALRLAWIQACEMTRTELYLAYIANYSAYERIVFMVLELYRRLKLRGLNQGYTIPFTLSQTDIADFLGLTNVHVNRTLHALQAVGLFEIKKRVLNILDYEALVAMEGSELEHLRTCDVPVGC
ncbi:MAG: Crp/Fnr family transcriptional regulator [Gammaproteobacteria bacterium]